VNLASPAPLPYREFMSAVRSAVGASVGLPATRWMAEVGAFFLRTDTELILKSRRVIPGRLREGGFAFAYERWADACRELASRWRR
jgi:NAD dependent epimerase/dehydratase family enzyme